LLCSEGAPLRHLAEAELVWGQLFEVDELIIV
jgi:hypothetical protein